MDPTQSSPRPEATPSLTNSRRQANSIRATYGSLSSPSSFSSPSVPASCIAVSNSQQTRELSIDGRSVRRKPPVDDLRLHQPDLETANVSSKQSKKSVMIQRHRRWRSASAEPALRARSRFLSPDRYMPNRSKLHASSSPLRTSRHPSLLTVRERLTRHRDADLQAFRPSGDGPHTAVSRPAPNRFRSFQPPHYTPSFVQPMETIEREHASRTVNGAVDAHRRSSTGSVWRLGGWTTNPGQTYSVEMGNGLLSASGTNASMINSSFVSTAMTDEHTRRHEQRLALALEIDTARKTFSVGLSNAYERNSQYHMNYRYQWRNGSWLRSNTLSVARGRSSFSKPEKVVPTIAFRVLDAPRLKDDYYCSVLAYYRKFRTLAVALAHRVYLWTEKYSVRYPPLGTFHQANYVTSLAFSSEDGERAILAVARSSGHVTLWSLLEHRARFEIPHTSTACSVAFRPKTAKRLSKATGLIVDCEDLLVGDDAGRIHYYSIDWPKDAPGSVTLLIKIEAHSQNVCGLVWASDGRSFMSGGNDNCALLFRVNDVFRMQSSMDTITDATRVADTAASTESDLIAGISTSAVRQSITDADNASAVSSLGSLQSSTFPDPSPHGNPAPFLYPNTDYVRVQRAEGNQLPLGELQSTPPPSPAERSPVNENNVSGSRADIVRNSHRHCFRHSAAVKAIAFAPWQPTLLATSGGSNDRQIHFHHTETGITLAVINVFAQVTSLVWSQTRREIVATFGYAQPEHDIRIAVFSWPSCECVVSIPWERKSNGEVGRALWAISYPGGPNDAAPERLQQANYDNGIEDARRANLTHIGPVRTDAGWRTLPPTPETSPEGQRGATSRARARNFTRSEGETWASRTEEEGSLIIACCDQTVKFFEVWAGKSKGRSQGLGSQAGVLGGSKVLEGLCKDVAIEEVGAGEDVIR